MSTTPEPLLDASIRLDSLPAEGRTLKVEAEPEQRAAIAERLRILGVERLSAKLQARPLRGGIRVEGDLTADVTQECVITFVPVSEHIQEHVSRVFLPGGVEDEPKSPGSEVFVDLEGEDLPDHFVGPDVDLTELIIETLSLALDPYPKAPGASVEGLGATDEPDEETSPFAALKKLQRPDD